MFKLIEQCKGYYIFKQVDNIFEQTSNKYFISDSLIPFPKVNMYFDSVDEAESFIFSFSAQC